MTFNTFLILFVLITVIISNSKCIVPGDLCQIGKSNRSKCSDQTQTSCRAEYNNLCESPYMHSCGNEKCARNMHSCGEYNLAERYMNSYLFSSQVQMTQLGSELELRMRNYIKMHKLLKTRIKNCPYKVYVWQESHVCKRRPKCLQPIKINMRNRTKSFFHSSVCPCNGSRGFECDSSYCTVSQEACNAFKNRIDFDLTSPIGKCPFFDTFKPQNLY